MIRQVPAGIDPLSVKTPKLATPTTDVQSPAASVGESALAASFVFVEQDKPVLARHPTVIHTTDVVEKILIPGEDKQAVVHSVTVSHPVRLESAVMLVTTLRIVLLEDETVCTIPLTSVLDIHQTSSKTASLALDIKTKDCRFFQLSLNDATSKTSLLKLITSLVFSIGPTDLFPLVRKSRGLHSLHDSPFNIHSELERFGRENYFTVTDHNSDFSVCHTYPRHLMVPSATSKETLLGSSRFRDKGRVPVLSWASPDLATGCMWRSSQPKSFILNRSADDEEYLKQAQIMFIIDCRPMLNAYANIAHGAGVESLGNYHKGIELWFAGIQNIHHVRDGWEKMFLLAQQHYTSGSGLLSNSSSGQSSWFNGLESAGWIELIASVLRASSVLVEKISSGINVLCRCSHGLDRTPQVVSLAMLAMDPYYRTITGFAVLIEKEWVAMGHRFHSRYCIGSAPHDDVSPIFSQWIECVYQLVVQNSDEFEFSHEYLVAILAGALSGKFGTFLFDSEKERIERGSIGEDEKIVESIWPALWEKRDMYVNHNFEKRSTGKRLSIDYRISNLHVLPQLWLSHLRIDI